MKSIFYSDPEEMKDFLLDCKPKKFPCIQEFYNYVGNFLLKKDPENPYIRDNINDWLDAKKNNKFEEEMLCQGYDLWHEFHHKDIVHLAQNHLGDGKPLEIVYALLDRKNKEYTLVCLCGYYSSWADSEFDTCIPVELREKTVSYFKGVDYASN